MSVQLLLGDCLALLPSLVESSIDTIIADPPAGIQFMGKEWDADRGGREQWIAWLTERMREGFRVLKPGGMALVWAIPRTSHWTATALEDAGFEIRDKIYHLFGQGFPKSHDISKAIDKMAGAEREVLYSYEREGRSHGILGKKVQITRDITEPATCAARTWQGYGTALKPACEEWILAMKPLDGTFAQNALEWGTAGINIDGCRIPTNGETIHAPQSDPDKRQGVVGDDFGFNGNGKKHYQDAQRLSAERTTAKGRWPSHVILDEEAGAMLDEMVDGKVHNAGHAKLSDKPQGTNGFSWGDKITNGVRFGDTGGASRFFYCAKASRGERNAGLEGMRVYPCSGEWASIQDARPHMGEDYIYEGKPVQNHHPTVKPLSLMRYLCRLTKPPTGGVVLDMFMGSGTTGCAAVLEGRSFIGMEISEEYFAIAEKRIANAQEKVKLPLLDEVLDL